MVDTSDVADVINKKPPRNRKLSIFLTGLIVTALVSSGLIDNITNYVSSSIGSGKALEAYSASFVPWITLLLHSPVNLLIRFFKSCSSIAKLWLIYKISCLILWYSKLIHKSDPEQLEVIEAKERELRTQFTDALEASSIGFD